MKKTIASLLIASTLLTACGSPRELMVNGTIKEYPTYGLLNQGSKKSDKVCYDWSVGNVVWSVLLFQTIIAPIYFIGFSLFNPTHAKPENGSCGIQ